MLSGAAATTISRGQWVVALVLLTAVVVIGLGALYAWWRRLGAQPAETDASEEVEQASAQRVCPTCDRRYPAEARFCAVDATALGWIEGGLASAPLCCPRCERSYEGVRFCPFDAEELLRADHEAGEHRHAHELHGADKICPTCAARYELGAAFCGKDGTRLLALH